MKTTEKIREMSATQLSEYVPSTLEEVVAYLKTIYPLSLPKVDTPEREIWVEVGRQELIKFLENTLYKHEEVPDVWTEENNY